MTTWLVNLDPFPRAHISLQATPKWPSLNIFNLPATRILSPKGSFQIRSPTGIEPAAKILVWESNPQHRTSSQLSSKLDLTATLRLISNSRQLCRHHDCYFAAHQQMLSSFPRVRSKFVFTGSSSCCGFEFDFTGSSTVQYRMVDYTVWDNTVQYSKRHPHLGSSNDVWLDFPLKLSGS